MWKKNIVAAVLIIAAFHTRAYGNPSPDTQETLTTVYSAAGDINPKSFTVKTGHKVHFQVNPKDTGSGCMSDIMIPGLWNKPELLVKGKPVVMDFVAQKPGIYKITCSMGVSRGEVIVK
ncbi:MAG: hypothetical protein HGB36_07220 [Chlorobiaceae bacterium]|nr:hypothetical protein [Chlorobiaceae bacterium]